jgi:hypothetical protein
MMLVDNCCQSRVCGMFPVKNNDKTPQNSDFIQIFVASSSESVMN